MPNPLTVPVLLVSTLLAPTASADAANANARKVAEAVIVATRAAGNARVPLYDDGCMTSKGGCPVKP